MFLVAASYLAIAAVATYPVVLTVTSALPGELTDPLEHLWLMRWAKRCLMEGRTPFYCLDLQSPTGVPLGDFPPMHLQTLLYLVMELFTSSDILRFNILWFLGFTTTGLASFALARWVVGRDGPAWLAGLGVMLCGPMMMHAHGHLETMQLGPVPLFLIGWIRFVDRPGLVRLGMASALYLLMVAAAPYFTVLAIFPAVWFVVWAFGSAGSGLRRGWLAGRWGWLVGFAAAVLPGLALLFSSQIWAAAHGFAMERPRAEFDRLGAPPWSYLAPTAEHMLGSLNPGDLYTKMGYAARRSECASYLGVVTLGLLAYAAVRRVRFARAGFWWTCLGLMVVLSWGARLEVGSSGVSLPAGWIYRVFPPFHLIRVPARFNLFAAVAACVPAAAGLRDLLDRLPGRKWRTILIGALTLLTVADLAMVPFPTSVVPPIPPSYQQITRSNPSASLVDAPMFPADKGQVFSSLWGYWQASHGARTTAGYPGLTNTWFDAEIVAYSPWRAEVLADPSGEGPSLTPGVAPRDAAWLFLSEHGFDYVVHHRGPWIDAKYEAGGERMMRELAEARVAEDPDAVVFDRARLAPPARLAWLPAAGWRRTQGNPGLPFAAKARASVVLFNPDPRRGVVLRLIQASAFAHSRVVKLVDGKEEITRWGIETGPPRDFVSPPIPLGEGLRRLRVVSDGDDRPVRSADRIDEPRAPYSFRLQAIRLEYAPDPKVDSGR